MVDPATTMSLVAFDGAICFENTLGCVEARRPLSTLETRTKTHCPPSRALCADTSLFWDKKQLTVSFLDSCSTLFFTDEQVRILVMDSAEDWTHGTSLRFKFLDSHDPHRDRADIRISFRESGTYSVVGTTRVGAGRPTMNLDFKGHVTEEQIVRAALHEFGHALGFQHEHCSPNCPLHLNLEAIKKDLGNRYPKDSIDDFVNENFTWEPEEKEDVVASPFDKDSVMMYTIKCGWNDEGRYIKGKFTLSETDREMVRKFYPPRAAAWRSSARLLSRRSSRGRFRAASI